MYIVDWSQVRPDIMMKLVAEDVYKPIHIVDYQAVCFREKKTTNPASMLLGVKFFHVTKVLNLSIRITRKCSTFQMILVFLNIV